MGGIAEYELVEGDDGGNVLVLSGPFLVSTIGQVDHDLRALDGQITKVDLSAISEIDTVGAWVACSISREFNADLTGASPRAERLIEALKDTGSKEEIGAPRLPVFERVPEAIGQKMLNARKGVYGVVGFLGALLLSIGSLIRHPKRFRWLALVRQLELVGISALPIVGLMSFLIGIVIAQQGAVQLAQFGAETLTVNLVGRITLRELGVLMTAIMVAGRSGSAFAAQIGTMKLTEEVDAMRVIGVSPMERLILPRILAAVLMMIPLGFFASVLAIIGGAFIANFALDIPFFTFLQRIREVVPLTDVWVGLIKAPVFGLIVGLAGCYQGMQVSGNAEEVGKRTTMAVVQAIFMVIVLDAFFAIFFTEIGWG